MPLLNRNEVVIRDTAKIIVTNNWLLYRTYALDWRTSSGGTLDGTLARGVNQLWEAIVSAAEQQQAVIYCVDEYQNLDERARKDQSTVQWEISRDGLSFDTEERTNEVSNAIDKMLEGWVQKLGGATATDGRYVLLVGGDRVIPYYRAHEPMPAPFLSELAESYALTEATKTAAKKKLLLHRCCLPFYGVWRDQ